MPIADGTAFRGHAHLGPSLARAPRTPGLSSSSGSSKAYYLSGWRAASAIQSQACLSRLQVTDSSNLFGKQPMRSKELSDILSTHKPFPITGSPHHDTAMLLVSQCSHTSGMKRPDLLRVALLSCSHILSNPSKLS